MYALHCTRPDIGYAVGILSKFTSSPGVEHWNTLIRVVRYLKGTINVGLHYFAFLALFEGYSDATWNSDPNDSKSITAWIFTLARAAISWRSKKQTCITHSIMESEFIAMSSTGEEIDWLRSMLIDISLWGKPIPPLTIYCDNKAAIFWVSSDCYNVKSRKVHLKHNHVDSDVLVITFVPSEKSNFAFVNAIEVISAPNDLIADVAQYVSFDKNEKISGLLMNGTWVTNDEYIKSSDGSSKVHFGGRINYQEGGASREVGPDNVYNTARVIRSSGSSVPELNMTWTFPVIGGYKYLVRMHFCDIASIARGPTNTSLPRAVDAILNGVEVLKIINSVGSFDAFVIMPQRRTGVTDSVAWWRVPTEIPEVNLKYGNRLLISCDDSEIRLR
ncbi:putative cytochrome 86A2-like [Capsicum annuum]|nr:putative cytochrome 86A2-like [Capsicum annuum]